MTTGVEKPKASPLQAVLSLVMAGALGAWVYFDAFPRLAADQRAQIEEQVTIDAMQQLNTAISGGASDTQICVYAQMVSAAIIQAKDSARLKEFKPTEERLCAAAGLR
ncbi:MAG: hypothetical protein HEQ38_20490 [Gemmatimonas sp.]|nr:hypothetical protein [Gemmatimonas sp.]MCO4101723.1 hypothetical protein [Gemmatimonas sp.]